MTSAAYPRRKQYFAQRFLRLMVKTCVANNVGQDAFLLLATVAATEDSKRYTGAVGFHNAQLMPILGIRKWERLDAARKACQAAGWLEYIAPRSGSKEVPLYWVKVPSEFAGLDDSPVDETGDLVRAAYEKGYEDGKEGRPKAYPKNGYAHTKAYPKNGDAPGYATGDAPGYAMGALSCPDPDPIPKEGKESPAGDAPAFSLKELIELWNRLPGVQEARDATNKRKQALRARLRDPHWRPRLEAALAEVAKSNFLQGVNDRGWRADLDWFLKPDSLTGILEGKYSRQPATKSATNGKPLQMFAGRQSSKSVEATV